MLTTLGLNDVLPLLDIIELEFVAEPVSGHAQRRLDVHAAGQLGSHGQGTLIRDLGILPRQYAAVEAEFDVVAGKLSFALKSPWDDGTTHLILTPHELLEKLAALVPPPRINLIRYHGLLAPSARDRDKIVPADEEEPDTPAPAQRPCPHRLAWATLLARVLEIDVTECPACGGRMRIIAALSEPASMRRYLQGMGLAAQPPRSRHLGHLHKLSWSSAPAESNPTGYGIRPVARDRCVRWPIQGRRL